jgi:hypothetical protein
MSVTWDEVRRALARLMRERGEWAGCPMPTTEFPLTVAPGYPDKDRLEHMFDKPERPEDDQEERFHVINSWVTRSTGQCVMVLESAATGKRRAMKSSRDPVMMRIALMVNSMGAASMVFDMQAEALALKLLANHVTDRQFTQFMLLGMFVETSKRSGVSYVFRKGRPTLALKDRGEHTYPLCALCLHPIGFYDKTFVGSMTPTDDVIAHLLLMRGDEAMFWRKANQHALDTAESGL